MKPLENDKNPPDSPAEGPETDGFEPARQLVLRAMLARAAFDGWTGTALQAAATEAGVDSATLAAAFPKGVEDMLRAWSGEADAEMSAAMVGEGFTTLKIREKVVFAVKARLAALRPHKEAARRAAALLALPIYAPLGTKLSWNTADAIWRGLGDTSTDFNFYSKRGILTGVWVSTMARWLSDDSQDEAATNAFLDARIENVMQIEKAKAKLRDLNIDPLKPVEWLAKLRYPAGQTPRDKAHDWKETEVDEALDESFPASDPPAWSPSRP